MCRYEQNVYNKTGMNTLMTGPLRKVNPQTDLLRVADLIELCFASTLDADGYDYLRHLRSTYGDTRYLSWAQGAVGRMISPLHGLVWEEDGRIIGNLSLIPVIRNGKAYYLIANVAVHPRERGRGIGRRLTEAALAHLLERGAQTAWLQVRDDNEIAYRLYRSLGFIDRARRTTWISSAERDIPVRDDVHGVSIHFRRSKDWSLQREWLRHNYPPELAWNLPIDISRLSPNLWQETLRFFRGEVQEHWAARAHDGLLGVLSWEPMRGSCDALWLAAAAETEDAAIRALLPYAVRELARRRRPLSLNYPAGRAPDAFLQAKFVPHQTLIWMSIDLLAYSRADMPARHRSGAAAEGVQNG